MLKAHISSVMYLFCIAMILTMAGYGAQLAGRLFIPSQIWSHHQQVNLDVTLNIDVPHRLSY